MRFFRINRITFFLIFLINIQIGANNLTRIKRKLPLIHYGKRPEYVFICGVGIPLKNLHYETVTTGIIFKARYFFATNSSQLYHQNTTNLNGGELLKKAVNGQSSKRKRSITSYDNLRWHFYKLLEYYANNLGLNGHSCILKSICEVSQNPFHLDGGHLWQELAHIIFQPQTSNDNWPYNLPNEYVKDVEFQSNVTCHDLYENCPRSLISQITKLFW